LLKPGAVPLIDPHALLVCPEGALGIASVKDRLAQDLAEHHLVGGGDLEDQALGAAADQRVAIGQSQYAGEDVRVEAAGVGPGRPRRSEDSARSECEITLGVLGQHEFHDLRTAGRIVVEDQQVARAGMTGRYKDRAVLTEEHLIADRAGVVGRRVAPAIEEVTALASRTTSVAGRFSRRGAVIDDPDLILTVGAEQHQVVDRVVVHRVHVVPVVGLVRKGRVVHVDQLGVIGHHAEVGLAGIEILDQVIPDVPFPDDRTGRRTGGLDLDDVIGAHRVAVDQRRIAAARNGLRNRLGLPGDHQHIAIGHGFDVVM